MRGSLTATRGWAIGTVLAFAACAAQAADLHAAEQALSSGRADDAIAQLQSLIAGGSHGRAELLLCRAYFSKEDTDNAVHACESALRTLGSDSQAQDWMGRVYGLRAGQAGPLTGYKTAKKVAAAFEAAFRLDPSNGDAADDLGEFYVEAPGIVGGGMERAQALEKQLEGPMPERAQRLRAEIAEKNKDYGTAEREFKAVALSRNTPDTWADLAAYYARRGQADVAVDAAKRSIALNRKRDASMVAAAEVLLKVHRDPQVAIEAIHAYLAGSEMSDAAPACRAHVTLGRLLAASGDKAGARKEFQAALSLASGYPPAQKGLSAL